MRIFEVLMSGRVELFHNRPAIPNQLLSSHNWNTAIILKYIFPKCSANALTFAMTKDCTQFYTGEILNDMISIYPEYKEVIEKINAKLRIQLGLVNSKEPLTPEEREAIKISSSLAAAWYFWLQRDRVTSTIILHSIRMTHDLEPFPKAISIIDELWSSGTFDEET